MTRLVAGCASALLLLGLAGCDAQDEAASAQPRPQIVVAATDLQPGTTLDLTHLVQREVDLADEGAVHPREATRLVNRQVLTPIRAGEPLRFSQLGAEQLALNP